MNWDSEKREQLEAALGTLLEAEKSFNELVTTKHWTNFSTLSTAREAGLREIVLSRVFVERQRLAERG